MTRLYKDDSSGAYYTLCGRTLILLNGATGRRLISYLATHRACIHSGLQLVGNNFKRKQL
ncbi:hypothetical protein GRNsp03_330 [Salmonella phage GRNsp03]|nr:hypothetical protein [Salmonella phage vB_SenAt-pSL2]URG17662.1 hypothetical protein GRN51_460 [Salmonella phage GRNsp51]UUJ74857.1 hypothetical protein GRNsp03_330 [Salmonella phage GRNsp03]